MMKPIGFPIFSSENKKLTDKQTILSEPIPSLDLLERACYQLSKKITSLINKSNFIHIVCGQGNNGADGLCLARILSFHGYQIKVSIINVFSKKTIEYERQLELLNHTNVSIQLYQDTELPKFLPQEVIIDAILGSGLNQKISGFFQTIIQEINQSGNIIMSIDNPSGLGTWDDFDGEYVHANFTFCLGTISPSVLNRKYEQNLIPIDIGLDLSSANPLGWYLTKKSSQDFINTLIPQKNKHHHKGSKGHALLIGGNKNMHGAIILAAQMANKIGTGNVTVFSHPDSLKYVSHLPEVQFYGSELNGKATDYFNFEGYQALGIGPGLDCNAATTAFLSFLLGKRNLPPLVIDADALNIISKNRNLLPKVPVNSVLTPHPKELERLFGKFNNENEKWKTLSEFARKSGIHILAKDTYSILFCNDGEIIVNGTGTEKLAKGGSGDKLTGIITGFVAQGIKPKHAAICGMFLLNELA